MFNLSLQSQTQNINFPNWFLLFLVYEFGNIAFVTNLTTQRGTMRLYFDHSWTESVNGKRLEKQENDLSEVRYFQARVQEPAPTAIQNDYIFLWKGI